MPDIRFWFLQDNGQRQFAAGGLGPRCRRRHARGRRADQPGQAHSPARQRGLDGGARPPGAARGARSPTSPPSSACPRRPSRRPCASPPSATSAPTSPSSTSATGRCRSACSSRRARAATGRCWSPSRSRPPRARPCRCRPWRASSWPRARPPSTATTACAACVIGADLVGDVAARQGGRRGCMALPAAKNLPAGRRDQAVRRRRDHGRGVRELRQGHGRRHHDGLRRAGAAVRQLPAADHHPVLAAAVDRRRHRRAGHHRPSRSACRW